MKKQDVTIKSIAEKAGVSISTVSYVISKKRKISDDVAKRVNDIMKEMGYLPNMVARNLASKKTWCIGLYTPTTTSIQYDLYFNSVLVGILDVLHKEGYQLLLYADYLNEQAGNHPDLTMAQPIDGALVMNPRENCIYKKYLSEMGIHHVILGMPVLPKVDDHYVAHDNEAAVSLAISHLLERGYRKPALVAHQHEYGVYGYVVSSYKKALRETPALSAKERIYSGEVQIDTGFEVASQEFRSSDPADSFIVQNDIVAIGLLKYMKENNISVPKDAGIISIGGTMTGETINPSLTTVAFDPYRLGSRGATNLLEIIRKERVRPGVELLPVKLKIRETT